MRTLVAVPVTSSCFGDGSSGSSAQWLYASKKNVGGGTQEQRSKSKTKKTRNGEHEHFEALCTQIFHDQEPSVIAEAQEQLPYILKDVVACCDEQPEHDRWSILEADCDNQRYMVLCARNDSIGAGTHEGWWLNYYCCRQVDEEWSIRSVKSFFRACIKSKVVSNLNKITTTPNFIHLLKQAREVADEFPEQWTTARQAEVFFECFFEDADEESEQESEQEESEQEKSEQEESEQDQSDATPAEQTTDDFTAQNGTTISILRQLKNIATTLQDMVSPISTIADAMAKWPVSQQSVYQQTSQTVPESQLPDLPIISPTVAALPHSPPSTPVSPQLLLPLSLAPPLQPSTTASMALSSSPTLPDSPHTPNFQATLQLGEAPHVVAAEPEPVAQQLAKPPASPQQQQSEPDAQQLQQPPSPQQQNEPDAQQLEKPPSPPSSQQQQQQQSEPDAQQLEKPPSPPSSPQQLQQQNQPPSPQPVAQLQLNPSSPQSESQTASMAPPLLEPDATQTSSQESQSQTASMAPPLPEPDANQTSSQESQSQVSKKRRRGQHTHSERRPKSLRRSLQPPHLDQYVR